MNQPSKSVMVMKSLEFGEFALIERSYIVSIPHEMM